MSKLINFFFILSLLYLSGTPIKGQATFVPTYNKMQYHYLDRLEMQSGQLFENIHTSSKPYNRQMIAEATDSLKNGSYFFSRKDRPDHFYLLKDNSEFRVNGLTKSDKALLKHFYQYSSDFYTVNEPDFLLKVNPVFHFKLMQETDNESFLFQNTRGIELRGMISKKVGFYSFLSENQARFPIYANEYIWDRNYAALPNQNRFIGFSGDDPRGVDWFEARGYITFQPVKNIDFQFGHDRNFIGNGYRSLFLSDFSGPYLFLKINTQVWKLQYTNLFAQLTTQFTDDEFFPFGAADGLKGKKFGSFHHLSLNVTKKLNIGLFESVIFGRENFVELNYFNPIIFYRSVETNLGSPDNVNIGLDFKWNPIRNLSFYGQLIIDEWNFSAITSNNGDWKNKNGFQLGAKTINLFGLSHLDLQIEYNQVRPYTYTHFDSIANYSHYNQALAHPFGANFQEFLGVLRYQVREPLLKKPVLFELKTLYAQRGLDADTTTNWGGNILLDYNTFEMELNNTVAQGLQQILLMVDFRAAWHWHHNLFLEGFYTYRKETFPTFSSLPKESHIFGLGLRMNIGRGEGLF